MCKKISFCCAIQLVLYIMLQSFLGVTLLNVERAYAAPEVELIKNGQFTHGLDPWRFKFNTVLGAEAYNIVHSKNYAKSALTGITNSGYSNWAIQLIQDDISLKKSYKYVLSFDAFSTIPRKIEIEITNLKTQKKHFSQIQSIDTSNKKYQLEFIVQSDDPSAQLSFNMGAIDKQIDKYHEITITNVSLKGMNNFDEIDEKHEEIQSNISLSRTIKDQVEFGYIEDMKINQEGSFMIPYDNENSKEMVLAIDNSGVYNSYSKEIISPFNFGIYASENLNFQGANVYVNGSTYSKHFINVSNKITITGTSASFTHHMIGNYDINNIKTIAEPIEMPQFYGNLMKEAAANSLIFDSKDFPDNIAVPMPGQPEVHIRYEPSQDVFRIVSNQGNTFYIDSSMYFKSNLVISLDDIVINNTSGGFLVADGDISVQGYALSPAGPEEKIFMYSIGGDIRFQTISSTINGIAYAPGNAENPTGGNIIFQGSNNSVYGSVAAKNISFEADGTQFNYGIEGIAEVIEQHFQSSYNKNLIQEAAKDFIDRYKGTNTKMGIIQYSDTSNDNDFKLYDLTVESNAQLLKDKIDQFTFEVTGESNMGDALRRANYMLTGLGNEKNSLKQIVLISGSSPNKWTSADKGYTTPKLGAGNAVYLGGDGTVDNDGSSLEYVKTVGNMIKENNIETIFINFPQNDIGEKLEQIAISSGAKKILHLGKHFYSASSISEMGYIYDIILSNERLTGLILADIEYGVVLPEGVVVVEVPEDMDVSIVEVDGIQRSKVIKKISDVQLYTTEGKEYYVPQLSFNIKVRFVKPGKNMFFGKDEVFRYVFKLKDASGEYKPQIIEEYFDDSTVNVTMEVDIG